MDEEIEKDENLDDSVVAEEAAAEVIKKLREKLKTTQKERDEYLAGWQRAKADLINSRQRDEADKKEFVLKKKTSRKKSMKTGFKEPPKKMKCAKKLFCKSAKK